MNSKILIIIGAVVATLALLIVLSAAGENKTSTVRFDELSSNQWGEVSGDDQIFFIEGIDFECPACASYHPLMERLREDYSDQVVFVARHYPLRSIHLNAGYAHRAAEAAAKQGKFWEMHDILFEQRDLWVDIREADRSLTKVDPIPAVEQFAGEIGLDIEQLKTDLESSQINSIINNDIAWVKRNTPNPATPVFFIQRGVDGPVEFIPSERIRTLEDATKILDGLLAEIGPAEAGDETGTEPTGDEAEAQPAN